MAERGRPAASRRRHRTILPHLTRAGTALFRRYPCFLIALFNSQLLRFRILAGSNRLIRDSQTRMDEKRTLMPRKGLVSRQYQYELPRFGVTEDGPRVQRRRVVAVLWVMALAVAVVLFISGPQGIMDTFTNLFNSKDGDPERDPQKPVGQRAAGLPLQKFAGVRPILLLKESTSRHQPDGTPKVDVYKRDIRLKARQVVKTLIVDRKSTVISMKRVTTKKYTPQPTPPSYKRFDFPTEKPGFNQTGFRKAVVVAGPGGNPTKAIQDKIDECSVQMRDPKYRICVITLSKAFYKVTALTIPAAMRDLRIEGSASRLLFTRNSRSELSGSIPLINVQGCTRCEIRNLTIDWDWDKWRIASLAKLPIGGVSGTSTEISWAFQILAPPMLANGLETESLYAVQSIHPVDPATFSVGVFGHKEFYLVNASFGFATSRRGGSGALLPDAGDLPPDVLDNPNAKIITTTSINITSPNSPTGLTPNYITTNPKITITFPRAGNPYGAQIGANKGHEIYWLIKHLTNEVPAFRLAGCTNFFLSAVHIRSAPGRAVEISRGCSNLVFDGLTVDEVTKRSVNMTRPLSVAGGGIHAPMGVENLLVQNAQFGFLGGDAINIAVPTAMQGFGYANKSGSNPNKTDPDYQRLLVPRAQSSRISFEMGDMVTFYNNSNLSPLSGHIADVSRKLTGAWPNAPLNGGTWFLNLDQTVPLSLFPYKFNHPQLLGLTNSAISAHNVVLRNVNSRYHRGRGIVVSAQLNVLLEKSSFSNLALAGLMIRSSAYTQVGVGTKNVVVANNFFSRCSIMSNESAVTIDAVNKEQVVIQNWRLNGNVNITGNTFERVSNFSVTGSSIRDIRVFNNRILYDPADPTSAQKGQMRFYGCRGLQYAGNVYCVGTCRMAIGAKPVSVDVVNDRVDQDTPPDL